jgi:rhodanese-related sulfurtransferase
MIRFAGILIVFISLIMPVSSQAKQPSLEQVKQNVQNMYKTVMDRQPGVTAKYFRKIIESEKEFVLLDVRSEDEYMAAHLSGALHVERGRIEWIIPNIIKKTDRTIYVYCKDGKRSGFATERLLEMGYVNAYHITGGFEGWVNSGYLVYNMHGEFILSPGGYNKREPMVGNINN